MFVVYALSLLRLLSLLMEIAEIKDDVVGADCGLDGEWRVDGYIDIPIFGWLQWRIFWIRIPKNPNSHILLFRYDELKRNLRGVKEL